MVSMRSTISQGFSNASLRGTYAFAADGRGGQMPTAYLGVFDFNGEGNLSGTGLINLPGAEFGTRQVVPFTSKGSYGIDADGSGYGSTRITSTFPDGAARETKTMVLVSRAEAAGDNESRLLRRITRAPRRGVVTSSRAPRRALPALMAERHQRRGGSSQSNIMGGESHDSSSAAPPPRSPDPSAY